LMLSKLAGPLKEWLEGRTGWRKHVKNWALGMIEEGLPDRAITRDINWGVEVPVDDLGPGKRIYVWFDAVIGYLSASKEWAEMQGTPGAWERWWTDPSAESYYIVGKDNIPFHTVIWPAMLMGYEGLNLPTDVPANHYVTFGDEKASTSRGVGRSIGWYLDRLDTDAIRYAVASVLPEQNDTDLSDGEIIRRVNEELVATWGNLVNRVLTMASRNFDGNVPDRGNIETVDRELIEATDAALVETGRLMNAVELRAALRVAMHAATEVNAYLNAQEPWRVINDDADRAGTVLWTAVQAISGIRVALSPFMPDATETLATTFGLPPTPVSWARPEVPGGSPLGEISPLFTKLEPDALDD
jgi:methionyl-tRNA synthetase